MENPILDTMDEEILREFNGLLEDDDTFNPADPDGILRRDRDVEIEVRNEKRVGMVACSSCGHLLSIGDYPFCPHGSIYESDALRVAPILVYQNPTTGAFWFPGSNNDPTDAPSPSSGFSRRLEITSIREMERLEKSMNARLESERADNLAYQHRALDIKRQELREENDAKLRARGITASRIRDLTREYIDRRTEARRRAESSRRPNFHIQVLAYDASNRQGHADERTGWKERKG